MRKEEKGLSCIGSALSASSRYHDEEPADDSDFSLVCFRRDDVLVGGRRGFDGGR